MFIFEGTGGTTDVMAHALRFIQEEKTKRLRNSIDSLEIELKEDPDNLVKLKKLEALVRYFEKAHY